MEHKTRVLARVGGSRSDVKCCSTTRGRANYASAALVPTILALMIWQ
jgi:hypothetical protein